MYRVRVLKGGTPFDRRGGGSRLFLWTQLSISRVWGVRGGQNFFVTKFGPIGTHLGCGARRKVFAYIGTHPWNCCPPRKWLKSRFWTTLEQCCLIAPNTFYGSILLSKHELSLVVSISWPYTHPRVLISLWRKIENFGLWVYLPFVPVRSHNHQKGHFSSASIFS